MRPTQVLQKLGDCCCTARALLPIVAANELGAFVVQEKMLATIRTDKTEKRKKESVQKFLLDICPATELYIGKMSACHRLPSFTRCSPVESCRQVLRLPPAPRLPSWTSPLDGAWPRKTNGGEKIKPQLHPFHTQAYLNSIRNPRYLCLERIVVLSGPCLACLKSEADVIAALSERGARVETSKRAICWQQQHRTLGLPRRHKTGDDGGWVLGWRAARNAAAAAAAAVNAFMIRLFVSHAVLR